MKILKISRLNFLLGTLAITQWACSPTIQEGLITYDISPGVLNHGSGMFSSPESLEKKVYFSSSYIAEPPINQVHTPLFHLHSHYDLEKRRAYDHRDFLGAYYVIEKEQGEEVSFIPLKGKKRILGFPCKKGQIQTREDTAIVWYTSKIPVRYSPWIEGFEKGFVLQMEQKVRVIDKPAYEKFVNSADSVIHHGSSKEVYIEAFPEKDTIRITRAINIQPIAPPDSLFKPHRPFRLVSLEEYERSIRNFTPVTSTKKP